MDPEKFKQLVVQYAQIRSDRMDRDDNDDDPDPEHAIRIKQFHPGEYPCEYCNRVLRLPPKRILQRRGNEWIERCVPCQNIVEKTDDGYQLRRSIGRQKKSDSGFVESDDWVQTGGLDNL